MASNYNYIPCYAFNSLATFNPLTKPSLNHVFFPYHPTETGVCQHYQCGKSLENDIHVIKSSGEFLIPILTWCTKAFDLVDYHFPFTTFSSVSVYDTLMSLFWSSMTMLHLKLVGTSYLILPWNAPGFSLSALFIDNHMLSYGFKWHQR